jgi:hypothetical protein
VLGACFAKIDRLAVKVCQLALADCGADSTRDGDAHVWNLQSAIHDLQVEGPAVRLATSSSCELQIVNCEFFN